MIRLSLVLFVSVVMWNYSFANETQETNTFPEEESTELAKAQDDFSDDQALNLETARPLVNDPIDVTGNFLEKTAPQKQVVVKKVYKKRAKPRRLSRVDKMKIMRKRLEKRNELLVKKQIEQMRLRQEVYMMKKLQKAFDQNLEQLN